MHETTRKVTDEEWIEAGKAAAKIIAQSYEVNVLQKFQNYSRAAQTGSMIFEEIVNIRDLMQMMTDIGYETQRVLLEKDIIRTGKYEPQREIKWEPAS